MTVNSWAAHDPYALFFTKLVLACGNGGRHLFTELPVRGVLGNSEGVRLLSSGYAGVV
jgi:hypothetical protein